MFFCSRKTRDFVVGLAIGRLMHLIRCEVYNNRSHHELHCVGQCYPALNVAAISTRKDCQLNSGEASALVVFA